MEAEANEEVDGYLDAVSYTHLDVYKRQEQYKAEMAYLWSRKALLVEYGKDSSEIQGQIYDKMIAEACLLYTSRCV